MRVVSVSKITRNGRISLGRHVMTVLRVEEGDFIQLVIEDGSVWIAKVDPRSLSERRRDP